MSAANDPPIRVLLIDDHRTVLWGLEKLIDSARPRMQVVGTASNSDDGLTAAAAQRPDVVLLDLDLGGDSGLDLLSNLVEYCGAKVLILTGTRDPEVREPAVLQGASGMVHKADRAELILTAIDRVARGEIWLDRATTAKLLVDLTGTAKAKQEDPKDAAIAVRTRKERDIVVAVVHHRGAPIKVITDTLCLGSHTVRNHLASIYCELDVHSRLDLFMYAKERGLDRHAA